MSRTTSLLAALSFTLALPALAQDVPYVQVPVVLDVSGLNGSHYTSDLTVANKGALASDIELTFLGTSGPSAGPYLLGTTLLPGRQAYFQDAIGTLRQLGAPFPTDGSSIVGTLVVRLPQGDVAPPFVGSRISTPNPDAGVGGSFGTYSLGIPVGNGSTGVTALYGLRENSAFRTNVALVHAGGGLLKQINLSLQLYDGQTGLPVGDPIAQTLQPGQWTQLSSILAFAGLPQGWVRITQTGGLDRYIAYAVVNDGGVGTGTGTSDGSWIDNNAAEGIIPVVLSSGPYRTELVLARPSTGLSSPNITLGYHSADSLGATPLVGSVPATLITNGQTIVPDAIAFLRQQGLAIPTTGSQGGLLRVTGALGYARVYSPNSGSVGGTFGVAFPAIPATARGHAECYIYGLRQDEKVRSNVAIANAATDNSAAVNFTVDLYDGATGNKVTTLTHSLAGGQWYQWPAPLTGLGVSQGFARVTCTNPAGGNCDFAAYGVVNDGSAPGKGTSDGSYIPMVRVR